MRSILAAVLLASLIAAPIALGAVPREESGKYVANDVVVACGTFPAAGKNCVGGQSFLLDGSEDVAVITLHDDVFASVGGEWNVADAPVGGNSLANAAFCGSTNIVFPEGGKVLFVFASQANGVLGCGEPATKGTITVEFY